ncbi:MAG: ABC transporter ATP-binding protein [Coriobacteriales bacterium]|nr:ABC transporter ATP-binding protein [Coriobacteriales bacterium]
MIYNLSDVTLAHSSSKGSVPVVRDLNLLIPERDFLAIVGPSGSGKTTLLNAMAGFLKPVSGTVLYRDTDLASLDPAEAAAYRNREIGLVHQFFNLIDDMTATENVMMPLLIRGNTLREARRAAAEILDQLGLGKLARRRPPRLSGGEQQRVAIGRALAGRPSVILADEPTGNLDRATTRDFMSLLGELHRAEPLTIVLVTHDQEVAAAATHRLDLGEVTACQRTA